MDIFSDFLYIKIRIEQISRQLSSILSIRANNIALRIVPVKKHKPFNNIIFFYLLMFVLQMYKTILILDFFIVGKCEKERIEKVRLRFIVALNVMISRPGSYKMFYLVEEDMSKLCLFNKFYSSYMLFFLEKKKII